MSGRRHGGKSFVLSLREWDRWRQELLADRCGLLLTYSTWERGARLAIHGAISSEFHRRKKNAYVTKKTIIRPAIARNAVIAAVS